MNFKSEYLEISISKLKLWEEKPRTKELIQDESRSIRELFLNDKDVKNGR